jgi:hypothetical protein
MGSEATVKCLSVLICLVIVGFFFGGVYHSIYIHFLLWILNIKLFFHIFNFESKQDIIILPLFIILYFILYIILLKI